MTHKTSCLLPPFLLLSLSTPPQTLNTSTLLLSLLSGSVTWSQNLPLHTSLCPTTLSCLSCCHCCSLLLGRAQNDSSWALGGKGGMKQSERRAAARTPGQLLQRALKAGTGTTENVDVCVCECADVQETAPTAPFLHLIPSLFKIPHRSTALSGIFSIARKECPCIFPQNCFGEKCLSQQCHYLVTLGQSLSLFGLP